MHIDFCLSKELQCLESGLKEKINKNYKALLQDNSIRVQTF